MFLGRTSRCTAGGESAPDLWRRLSGQHASVAFLPNTLNPMLQARSGPVRCGTHAPPLTPPLPSAPSSTPPSQVPSFLMYAGLVFVPLSQPYLHEFGEDWIANSPRRLVEKALNGGGGGPTRPARGAVAQDTRPLHTR